LRILVTGSAGFLGAAVVRRLLAHGHDNLRCFVRSLPEQANSESAAGIAAIPGAEYFVGDLRSKADAEAALDGVGTVYHVAGATQGSPADMVANTVVGSKNMLEAIEGRSSIRVVLVSSFSVYGTAGLPAGAVIDEETPLESRPDLRDGYAYAKLRQERLFREYQERYGFDLAVLRPGVIYGPGARPLSPRVGLDLFGLFLHLGRNTPLPLTYVDNCAEALVVVGSHDESWGGTYNVVDDDLPTSKELLREYRRRVKRIPYVTVPYRALLTMSTLVERYHRWSRGQLPAVFTPYKTKSLWKGNTFTNQRLKSLGWRPIVSTEEGIRRTMASLRDGGNGS
jgi:nucleoside-diphosphate-sugar epimerase